MKSIDVQTLREKTQTSQKKEPQYGKIYSLANPIADIFTALFFLFLSCIFTAFLLFFLPVILPAVIDLIFGHITPKLYIFLLFSFFFISVPSFILFLCCIIYIIKTIITYVNNKKIMAFREHLLMDRPIICDGEARIINHYNITSHWAFVTNDAIEAYSLKKDIPIKTVFIDLNDIIDVIAMKNKITIVTKNKTYTFSVTMARSWKSSILSAI